MSVNNSDLTSNSNLMVALEEFLNTYKKEQKIRQIPLNIFSNRKLGVLEAVVKYLKENNDLTYVEISKILNRDERTIWTTYRKASIKYSAKFTSEDQAIDVSIFTNRELAPLKALITHLKNSGMNLKQISQLLNRNYKTIWTTYKK